MRKNPNLFTIGEVAQAVGITRRILLHYEECGLVQPDVKDGPTGNRYYSIDTFVKIHTIRIFQNLGLSLNEIRGYFDDSVDLPQLVGRLETLRDELDRHIEKLRERSNDAPPQVRRVLLPRQTVYRRVYPASTVAERTALLHTLWSRPSRAPARLRSARPSRRGAWVSMSRRCPRRRRSASTTTGLTRTCPPRRRSSAPTRGGMDSRPRGRSDAFIWRARRSTRTPRSSSRRSLCRLRRSSRALPRSGT